MGEYRIRAFAETDHGLLPLGDWQHLSTKMEFQSERLTENIVVTGAFYEVDADGVQAIWPYQVGTFPKRVPKHGRFILAQEMELSYHDAANRITLQPTSRSDPRLR